MAVTLADRYIAVFYTVSVGGILTLKPIHREAPATPGLILYFAGVEKSKGAVIDSIQLRSSESPLPRWVCHRCSSLARNILAEYPQDGTQNHPDSGWF